MEDRAPGSSWHEATASSLLGSQAIRRTRCVRSRLILDKRLLAGITTNTGQCGGVLACWECSCIPSMSAFLGGQRRHWKMPHCSRRLRGTEEVEPRLEQRLRRRSQRCRRHPGAGSATGPTLDADIALVTPLGGVTTRLRRSAPRQDPRRRAPAISFHRLSGGTRAEVVSSSVSGRPKIFRIIW